MKRFAAWEIRCVCRGRGCGEVVVVILLGDLCAQTRCCLTLRRAGAGCGCRLRERTGGVVDCCLPGAESVRLSWSVVIVIALVHGRG